MKLGHRGLKIFVSSQPYRGESRGGDVHYVSVCAGSVLTRLILGDVSGHGEAVVVTSRNLRTQMRRFINFKRQDSLIHSLNREFTRLEESGRFATAIVASYLSHRQRFTICNAGHPRPLWYRSESESWSFVDHALIDTGRASNLPLGLDEATEYQQFDLKVSDGDSLVLFTDALIEATDIHGQLLGESGLHQIVTQSQSKRVRQLGRSALDRGRQYSPNHSAEDDVTLVVLEFSATTKLKRICRTSPHTWHSTRGILIRSKLTIPPTGKLRSRRTCSPQRMTSRLPHWEQCIFRATRSPGRRAGRMLPPARDCGAD